LEYEVTELIRTSFHCPADLLDRLKEIAEQEDRPVAWLVRAAIEDYVERYGDTGAEGASDAQ
jgi:predicted transcriptional regulator